MFPYIIRSCLIFDSAALYNSGFAESIGSCEHTKVVRSRGSFIVLNPKKHGNTLGVQAYLTQNQIKY